MFVLWFGFREKNWVMEMEELGDRSELSVTQREEERERRRMRDRQRRQSMTIEQRERHLARRRRNYQLRRLRAVETATRLVDNDTSRGLEMVLNHENQTPQIGFQGDGFDSINGFLQGKEKLNAHCLESMSEFVWHNV